MEINEGAPSRDELTPTPSPSHEAGAAWRTVAPAELALLASVFVVAACGLVYELAAGSLASYLLGDSVLQFSTVIGTYLFAMGIGSWASRWVTEQLVAQFIRIELLVGALGGAMPAALYLAHASLPAGHGAPFRVLLYALVLAIGVLVGLEIPLVMRILRRRFSQRYALRELVAQVLTFDYLGALAVALAFPLLFVPHLGLMRTGVFFGVLNVLVAVWALWLFRAELAPRRSLALASVVVLAALAGIGVYAERLTTWVEDGFYGGEVVLRESSDYQRVVLTSGAGGVRLYLNGNLQFHSRDEYRYHEALVHPAMAAHGAPKSVLILGGGDGMAAREVLRWPSVQQVTLVELDPHIARLAREQPLLTQLNSHALASPKLALVSADAFTWLANNQRSFDVVIVDFPDPSNFSLGKLYTTTFYQRLDQALSASGFAVIQTTSPLMARRSFWTVVATVEAVGFTATPYHAHVPSFGEWGFVLAHRRPFRLPTSLPPGLRYLTPEGVPAMLQFAPDMARVPAEPNRLSNQLLVHLFEEEWGRVHR